MKNSFLMIILICFTFISKAGIGIYGTIAANSKTPIAGITVFLLNDKSEPIAKIISNTGGEYGFDIANAGNYGLQIMLTDSTSQMITNIPIAAESVYYDFLLKSNLYKRDKNIASLTAAELEKMPTQDYKQMMQTKGNFDTDANGNMRSRTLGNGVRLIVDGQVMSDNSGIQFIPGSIGSMEVLKR